MRYAAAAGLSLIAACAVGPQTAPIQYKTPLSAEQPVDGVDLSIMCELAERIGTNYHVVGVDKSAATALEDQYGALSYLNSEGVQCGQDIIDLAFVIDPRTRMISTWGEARNSNPVGHWGSCLADPTRLPGDRVIYCEVQAQDGVALEIAATIEPPPPETPETETQAEFQLVPLPEIDPTEPQS